jgi:heterodisulfide reductase subunit C2
MQEMDLAGLDPQFKYEVMEQPGGEGFKTCYACGTCAASCPIWEVNETFNPKRIIRMVLLGMREEVLKSDFIWLCSTCYACQERCPQGVSITELMIVLKNMAFKEGNIPQGVRMQLDRIREQGRIYAIDDFDNKKRVKADLPALPTSCEDLKVLLDYLEA